MNPGETISLLRKNKGLSQELLAERCQVSLRTIQRIESGSSQPRPYTLKMIADALDTTIAQLTPPPMDQVEDTKSLGLINLSALLVLIIPLGNIILPFILWRRNETNDSVKETGGRIISFQIFWTLATLTVLVCTGVFIIPVIGAAVVGRFPPIVLMVYGCMLMLNLVFIIGAAIRLQKGDVSVYSFVPRLL